MGPEKALPRQCGWDGEHLKGQSCGSSRSICRPIRPPHSDKRPVAVSPIIWRDSQSVSEPPPELLIVYMLMPVGDSVVFSGPRRQRSHGLLCRDDPRTCRAGRSVDGPYPGLQLPRTHATHSLILPAKPVHGDPAFTVLWAQKAGNFCRFFFPSLPGGTQLASTADCPLDSGWGMRESSTSGDVSHHPGFAVGRSSTANPYDTIRACRWGPPGRHARSLPNPPY